MTEVFLKIVNMSISASWLVAAVLVLRFALKKAPKWVNVLLWGIVAVRLLCPFTIESALSLIPSAQTIPEQVISGPSFDIQTGIAPVDDRVNDYLGDRYLEGVTVPTDHGSHVMTVLTILWLTGMLILAAYTVISYARLNRNVRTATRLYDNIFQSAHIPSPFVLGIIRPKIYLPYGMDEADMSHVIAHEQTHIRRKDHWWKPLGFLLLTIHWFNPVMWAAYILLCRDIELACDEKVIAQLGRDQRADYSQALLSCSVSRKMIAACPLAFGEVGVKERVKNVLNYKKPAFWVIVVAMILCALVAVCFLTDPQPSREFSMTGHNVADLDPWQIVDTIADIEDLDDGSVLNINGDNFSQYLTADFEWRASQAMRFYFYRDHQLYGAQLRIFPEDDQYFVTEPDLWPEQERKYKFYHYLQALKYLPQDEIRVMCPYADGYIVTQREDGSPGDFDRVITYTADGTTVTDGWQIHLELQPLHDDGGAYSGTGGEVIQLFYRDSGAEVDYGMMMWFNFDVAEVYDEPIGLEKTHPAYPGVTFRCDGYQLTAENEIGQTILIAGTPIRNAFFTDLTGDGYPEICATVNYGSDLVDTHVVVCDYVNGQEYTLWDRGNTDFSLRLEDDILLCDSYSFVNGAWTKGDPLTSGALILADAGGGSGKRLMIDMYTVKPGEVSITGIVDRSVTEQIPTKEALEVFYEDDQNTYSFASIRSHLVMVTYSDGSSEDIKTAMAAGRASIADLGLFGIDFYVDPKEPVMMPSQADLEGFVAEYLFVPMNGASYRYEWGVPFPDWLTPDEVLYTFTEETEMEGIVWEVCSLKEYPGRTKLLLRSGTGSEWLCEYTPATGVAEPVLQDIKNAGYVIEEDGILTGGQDILQAFYEATRNGEPATVKVAHWWTLDPERTASATYEAYKEDYPMLLIEEISYDGEIYTVRSGETVKTYEYLMKYTVSGTPAAGSQTHVNRDTYVLTHSNTVTWDQLWNGLISSAAGAYIDHYTICTDEH